jgi:hypothetical protein
MVNRTFCTFLGKIALKMAERHREAARSGNAKKSLSLARPTPLGKITDITKRLPMVAIGPSVSHHTLAFLALNLRQRLQSQKGARGVVCWFIRHTPALFEIVTSTARN